MTGTKSRMKPKAAHEMKRKAKMKEGPTRNAGMGSTDRQVGKEKREMVEIKVRHTSRVGGHNESKPKPKPKRGVK